MRTVLQVAAGVAVVAGVLWLAFVLSFRSQLPPVLRAVRRMNRRFVNPRQLRTAGGPGAYASVVHHRGRTTGRPYRTPVTPVETEDGFLIALPYGPGADWVRNVISAGGGEVEHEGWTLAVERPELVGPEQAGPYFAPRERRMQRVYGVRDFLLLRRTG